MGAKNAKVTFIHSLGTSEVNLVGAGLVSGISVSPHPLDFGAIRIGNYRDLPVTITNTGNVTLRVTNFEITGANAYLFGRYSSPDSSNIGFTLAPSARYTTMVRFRPDVPGYKTAMLRVVSDIGSASITLSGNATSQEISVDDPTDVSGSTFLFQSNPNPVRLGSEVAIRYGIDVAGDVNLTVYDLLGREVAKLANEYKSPGLYSVNLNTKNLPSGIYFYKLRAPGYEGLKKIVVVR
jgi:hypothetical protein